MNSAPHKDSATKVINAGEQVCLTTRSPRLSDALLMTATGRSSFWVERRGFLPIVFENHPWLKGFTWIPRLRGLQLKSETEDWQLEAKPKPRLFVSPQEREQTSRFIREHTFPGNERKPLCVIHPWYSVPRKGGSGRTSPLPVEFWDELVRRHSGRYRFWQVGLIGQGAVQGCEYYALAVGHRREVRDTISLMAQADLFIGIDSAPMWMAQAFSKRSLIFFSDEKYPRSLEGEPLVSRLHINSKTTLDTKGFQPWLDQVARILS